MSKYKVRSGTSAVQVFCIFFALFGINIRHVDPTANKSYYGQSGPKCIHKGFYLIRIITFAAFGTFVAGTSCALREMMDDTLTLLDFVRVAYNLMAYTTICLALVVMNIHAAELSQILFESEFFVMKFYKRYFFRALLLNVASLTTDVYSAVDAFNLGRSSLIRAGRICGIYMWQGQTAALCMYLQCEVSIRTQLGQLEHLVRSSSFSDESISRIAQAKHSIRQTIGRVNSLFGTVLFLYYMKLFTLVTLRLGGIIMWGTEQHRTMWLHVLFILSVMMQLAQIYQTTRLGSEIISDTQRVVRFLYQPRRMWDESKRKALDEVRCVLEFREYFDALFIVDSFVNKKATIFTFLGTMFTCVAIILQFDSDVVKSLEIGKMASKIRLPAST